MESDAVWSRSGASPGDSVGDLRLFYIVLLIKSEALKLLKVYSDNMARVVAIACIPSLV